MLEVIEETIPVRLRDIHAIEPFVGEGEILLQPGAQINALPLR